MRPSLLGLLHFGISSARLYVSPACGLSSKMWFCSPDPPLLLVSAASQAKGCAGRGKQPFGVLLRSSPWQWPEPDSIATVYMGKSMLQAKSQ